MKTSRKKQRKPPKYTAAEIAAAKWFTCAHEAGHAVAREVLKAPGEHTTTMAVVLDFKPGRDMGWAKGLAYTPSGLSDLNEAVMRAAGKAATDFLLPRVKPPAVRAPRPGLLRRTVQGEAKELEADCAAPDLMPDDVALARFCIQNQESHPERWQARHSNVVYRAEVLVKENARRIIAAADELFARGLVLPSRWKIIFGPLPPLPPERFKTPPVDTGTTPAGNTPAQGAKQ